MHRVRDLSPSQARALAEWIGVDPDDVDRVATRTNALLDLFRDLEDDPVSTRSGPDAFDEPPSSPGEDPHNAWLSRFVLARPEASGALSGLDVAVKDNTCVRGVEMTNGSRAFEGYVPANHAEVVDRLLDAGARLVGKTNMDELAFGPTSETSAFGPTGNPRAPGHVAGGSSSGSAAAVAAGEADLALGSDTGGSVRIPASYCGVVGVKPTYGRVPRYGFAPLAPSMDHVGPLAPDLETAAKGLAVLADPPPGREKVDYAGDLGADLDPIAVGVPESFFGEYVTDGVERRVREAIDDLADAGASVREVSVPGPDASRPVWWGIAPAEFAATYLTAGAGYWRRGRVEPSLAAAMRRVRRADAGALGPNVTAMLVLGASLIQTYGGYHYVRARNRREALREEFDDALADVDVLATPATPTPAPGIGGFVRGESPPVNWNTHPTNLTGHPSVSVPCGEVDGRPIGLQLIAPWHAEDRLLDVAFAYEGL